MRPMLIIGRPRLRAKGDFVRVVYPIRGWRRRRLYFEVPKEYEAALTKSCDAAVIGLLLPAMYSGRDIIVRGPMSATLCHAINNDLTHILRRVVKGTQLINVRHHSKLRDRTKRGKAVITGLSSGVDSLATVSAYLMAPDVPDELKISHFVLFDAGVSRYKPDASHRALFDKRYERAEEVAAAIGKPILRVNSNLGRFYKKGVKFQQTCTLRNAATAHALSGLAHTWLYSSTYSYDAVKAVPFKDVSLVDPMVLPLLSTRRMQCVSANSAQSRVEKTAMLADMEVAQRFLNVCVSREPREQNCSRCKKCLRTAYTLKLLRKLDKFKTVFDMAAFDEAKGPFVKALAKRAATDPLMDEVLQLRRKVQGKAEALTG